MKNPVGPSNSHAIMNACWADALGLAMWALGVRMPAIQ
jgi:hypothetical protein